jgi:hypothetical protein
VRESEDSGQLMGQLILVDSTFNPVEPTVPSTEVRRVISIYFICNAQRRVSARPSMRLLHAGTRCTRSLKPIIPQPPRRGPTQKQETRTGEGQQTRTSASIRAGASEPEPIPLIALKKSTMILLTARGARGGLTAKTALIPAAPKPEAIL